MGLHKSADGNIKIKNEINRDEKKNTNKAEFPTKQKWALVPTFVCYYFVFFIRFNLLFLFALYLFVLRILYSI